MTEDGGKVIDYVVEKYGRESVCQIVTFGTMGSKSVIRDVSRVLGVPLSEADRIAKLVPDGVKVSLADAKDQVGEFARLYQDPDPNIRKLMHYATVLEGSARHTGVHAAGVIIAPGDVSQYVPVSVQKGKGGAADAVVTQYDGKYIEDFGLLKMDFLGLKTLTILDDALALIKETYGVDIDLDALPLDDPDTYKLFQKGDTVSIFQFESSGMREWMRKLKPTSIDDLIAMNALYRPGPMDLIPSYIDRKHGREPVEYPHPMLESILAPTYGIPVYQEQVMQMAQVMGGFTLGGADLLRRAMGKKDHAKMAKEKETFVDGAGANGVGTKKAEEVFDMMAKFAGYGFNKCAHAQTKVRLADGTKTTLAAAYRQQPSELMAMWPDGEIRPPQRVADRQDGQEAAREGDDGVGPRHQGHGGAPPAHDRGLPRRRGHVGRDGADDGAPSRDRRPARGATGQHDAAQQASRTARPRIEARRGLPGPSTRRGESGAHAPDARRTPGPDAERGSGDARPHPLVARQRPGVARGADEAHDRQHVERPTTPARVSASAPSRRTACGAPAGPSATCASGWSRTASRSRCTRCSATAASATSTSTASIGRWTAWTGRTTTSPTSTVTCRSSWSRPRTSAPSWRSTSRWSTRRADRPAQPTATPSRASSRAATR